MTQKIVNFLLKIDEIIYYLNICQEKTKESLIFLPRLLTLIFLSRYFSSRLNFRKEQFFLSLNTNCGLKILIKSIIYKYIIYNNRLTSIAM